MSAPRDSHSNRFSNRIRENERLSQDWPTDNHESPCVWVIDNQLLFTEDVSDRLRSVLTERGIDYEILGTLYERTGEHTPERAERTPDIHIVEVALPGDQDIFSLTRELRGEVPGRDRDVTPNHILIP